MVHTNIPFTSLWHATNSTAISASSTKSDATSTSSFDRFWKSHGVTLDGVKHHGSLAVSTLDVAIYHAYLVVFFSPLQIATNFSHLAEVVSSSTK